MSLQSRRETVLAALEALPAYQPTSAVLTFLGKPVVGNHGIFAEFAAAAVNKFAEAVAAFAASSIAPLGDRGPIRDRENYQLLITGTALGSFGFELEEIQPQTPTPVEDLSIVGQAIVQIRGFLEATKGSDDDLADAAAETSPRSVSAIREFLQTVASHEAICALEHRDIVFRFDDVGQIRRSVERLSQDNLHEEEKWIEGSFQGVLPNRRTFEFRDTEAGEIISGKVGLDIEDAGTINHILEQPVRIQVMATRIGNGRPRYVLLRFEEQVTEE
ncbi:MAG: hypothetical protein V1792_17315 [Pseudomonadota bacterium]